jgi:hypothetical protein
MPSVRSALAVAGALFALSLPTSAWAAGSCTATRYSYAGLASLDRSFGVAATLEPLLSPVVSDGHVAAWVGVGGPGFGPHGEDEWVQVGVNSLPYTPDALYYEVARPGQAIEYGELQGSAVAGTRHRVAVLELPRHRGWWQVWVDGSVAAGPFFLTGSDGAWEPLATAESWGAGADCNRFAYRFDHVSLAAYPGGGWRALRRASAFADTGYRVIRRARASFTAVARTL